MPTVRPRRIPQPERRRVVAAALGAIALGAATALAPRSASAAAAFDLEVLTALLGRVRAGEATFVETRRIEMLDRTLMSSGRLSFKAPDVFVRETLKPRHEKIAVDGNTLTMSLGDRSRTMQLDASPEAGVVVEAIRGTLTGNRAALERLFETRVSGDSRQWTLELVPRELRLRGQVASVRVAGRQSAVHEVRVLLADGDQSVMTIEPVSSNRGAP
jgi:outer membrane lipoprotein-sorting protein